MAGAQQDTIPCPDCGGIALAVLVPTGTHGHLKKITPFSCDCGWLESTVDLFDSFEKRNTP